MQQAWADLGAAKLQEGPLQLTLGKKHFENYTAILIIVLG